MKKKIVTFAIGAMLGAAALVGTQARANTPAKAPETFTIEMQDRDIFSACGEIVDAVHTDDWSGYMVIRASYGTEYRAEIDPEDLHIGDPVIFTVYDPWEAGEGFEDHYKHSNPLVIRVHVDSSRY